MTNAVNLSAIAPNVSTGGQLAVAGINATGTPSSTTYLRGDSTWATVSSNPGTVTSVTAGSGLTGGTITSSGTVAIDTSTYAIGQIIHGRPATLATYAVGATVAGSSLYTVSTGVGVFTAGSFSGLYGSAVSVAATLINTGTWKCISPCGVLNTCTTMYLPGMWVRVS